jgi:hypothetical protein
VSLSEYILLFVFVAIMGAGIPGPGDASLIAAGTLADEGRLNVGVVLATAMVAWMLGSVAGYEVGVRGGRRLLDHPGRLGVVVIVAIGLGARAGLSAWRASRQRRTARAPGAAAPPVG